MRIKFFAGLAAVLLIIIPLAVTNYFQRGNRKVHANVAANQPPVSTDWKAPDTSEINRSPQADLVRYGRQLILHTSRFFGPLGSIAHSSNGMNCNNCHVEGGTKPFANNFSSVASVYPVFKNRSGQLETIEMRINDCFKRSLNGAPIPDSGKEMKAMIAYIKWVGKDVPKGTKTKNAGTEILPLLTRAADTNKGKIIYRTVCESCHGKKGEGKLLAGGKEYAYPPLWGKHSYNVSAGIFQLSKFAGYVKNNMPYGSSEEKPQLSNEDAWDVAAYVNSQPRVQKHFKMDWPDISTKPFDYPFAPFTDSFTATQHKYGPFEAIQNAHKKAPVKSG